MTNHVRLMEFGIPVEVWVAVAKITDGKDTSIKNHLKGEFHDFITDKYCNKTERVEVREPEPVPQPKLTFPRIYYPTDLELEADFPRAIKEFIDTRDEYWKDEFVGERRRKDVDEVGDFLVAIYREINKDGLTYFGLSASRQSFLAVVRKAHMAWVKRMRQNQE